MASDRTDSSEERTQTCDCGNDTYHIKWDFKPQVWAECTECGRVTTSLGPKIDAPANLTQFLESKGWSFPSRSSYSPSRRERDGDE